MGSLQSDILRLLKEDETLRYAVLGLLGYDTILRRLEEHDKKFNAILEELSIHRAKLEEHDKKFNEIIAEIKDLRKVTNELTASMGTIGRRLGKDMEKMVLRFTEISLCN
jgi:chromosome segregation ATPase